MQLWEEGILSTVEWTVIKGSISKNDTYFGNSRDLLEIINGSKMITIDNFSSLAEVYEHELSFSQMYNFLKMYKDVTNKSDIPHSSCLSEVCENASLLAKGINSNLKPTTHNLVEKHTCDSSSKDCMLGNCPTCLKPGLSY